MRFGLNTLLYTSSFDLDHLHLLEQIKRWGFDGIEIGRFSFDHFPARLLREAVRDAGLEATVCSAFSVEQSLICEDAGRRRSTSDFLRRAVEATAELGATVLAGPFLSGVGYLPGRRRDEEEWKRGVDEIRALGDTLRKCDVTLAIEPLNRFETYFLNTAEDAARFTNEVHDPYVGVLLDTFHSNIEDKHIGDAVRALGTRLAHVHSCENDRGVPGSGHIDWDELFAALNATGYDGWCVIESFGARIPEIAAAASVWRDFAPSPECFGEQGLTFLRDAARRARAAAHASA
jgi:D-psicose/D-tagatose/L-ribulose 3-epimerase